MFIFVLCQVNGGPYIWPGKLPILALMFMVDQFKGLICQMMCNQSLHMLPIEEGKLLDYMFILYVLTHSHPHQFLAPKTASEKRNV
ncbi:hypothetical protein GDO81_001988 [Engystomops pustulosus]|uniref:Uncharacterized protein n=1 Tax=Engystomops pustulosus TaxID=76066 RepID=A0AAV7DK69_ENGPU|nr:hypothetical protein GDO81_001988 [Engystomops pustulosus]